MVRLVHVDAAVEAHAQGCSRLGIELEVGFIIGRPQAGGKDLLLLLIPTPSSETGPAARMDGCTHITLDTDWVVEHALQLSAILIGGLSLVGMYVTVDGAVFNASSTILAGVLREVDNELKGNRATVLLHIDPKSGKLTAKDARGGGTLRPCDFDVRSLSPEMVTLQTRYVLDVPLPGPTPPAYKAARRVVLADVASRLEGAVLATSQSRLLAPGLPLGEAATSAGLPDTGPWQVSLYGAGAGVVSATREPRLKGVLDARACVSVRDSVAAARDALADDLRAGVAARLAPGAPAAEGGEAPLITTRRVFLRLPGGPVSVAEVLGWGERPPTALARFQEVLGGAVVAETLDLEEPLEVSRFVPGMARRTSPNETKMMGLLAVLGALCIVLILYIVYVHKG